MSHRYDIFEELNYFGDSNLPPSEISMRDRYVNDCMVQIVRLSIELAKSEIGDDSFDELAAKASDAEVCL